MERVVFLLEQTGERLGCLLNPESVVIRRRSGIQARETAGGLVAGSELSDDPLFFTGGGQTELRLNLLFDISLAGSSIATEDVRDLTRPLWDLAENTRRAEPYGRPPASRFVWGKSWNILVLVAAVAERLEYFTPGGVPGRSWMRMRLLRTEEPSRVPGVEGRGGVQAPGLPREQLPDKLRKLIDQSEVLEIGGGGPSGVGVDTLLTSDQRLDQFAFWAYGDASWWRWLAWLNNIDDPLRMEAGQLLQITPRADAEGLA